MTEWEKIHSGLLYQPSDPAIMAEQLVYFDKLKVYNDLPHVPMTMREQMLPELFAQVGENVYVESPFHANWGGRHVHLGSNIYININAVMVDDTHIYIGDNTMLGPNVTIATAGHPLDPQLRGMGLQYNAPVHIGRNCWLGAGVVVMPGVTIGDNTVIGAGSIVTRDIPSGVVAVGNPCRVLRQIGEHDRKYYYKDREINWAEFVQE